jgi:3-hydroxyacyl-[acyl-carrier-protein] dehydratase
MDSIRFRRPVVPGDTLRVESLVKKCRGKLWQFSVEATVDGERVAEGEMLANIHLAGDAK